jgi:hypothetical protein
MTVNLSLLGGAGWQFLDNNGSPLSGNLLLANFVALSFIKFKEFKCL